MFRLSDGHIVLSATDLTNHLACPHLTQSKLAAVRGERTFPRRSDSAHAKLLRRRGDEHEAKHLARLTEEAGGDVVDLTRETARDEPGARLLETRETLEAAAARTADAMRAGTRLIYQGHFFDGTWQGSTDFLIRVDGEPSDFGDYAYEVVDTKLSKKVKPHVVHQLEVYSRLVGLVQGRELSVARVILGDDVVEPVELTKYGALHRRVVRRFEAVTASPAVETYPEPVAHCPICSMSAECVDRRKNDDHLSLIANARRGQRQVLVGLGLETVASLAGVAADVDSGALSAKLDTGTLGEERFEILSTQASLQVQSRTTDLPTRKHLKPVRATGYALLPKPSPGDIFFDLEGDPYVGTEGIEYLWGWNGAARTLGLSTTPGDYECVWAHDEAEEKEALERFIDHVLARQRLYPDLHVFHYAPHEKSKLVSLSVKYQTREAEIDQLLRTGTLVDLYAVVVRALQVGEDSYSLKKLERHHEFKRLEETVRHGGGSIVAYEGYLETGDETLLEAIRAYNEEDCRSTESLRNWLQGMLLPEAAEEFGVDFDALREPEPENPPAPPEWLPPYEQLATDLRAGLPDDAADDTPLEAERRLTSHLLLYHYRESKPEWQRYFQLTLATTPEELAHERDALGLLSRDESVEPVPIKSSMGYAFTYPEQEFKLSGTYYDAATGKAVSVESIDRDARRIVIKRKASSEAPWPQALVNKPLDAGVNREAVFAFGESLLAGEERFAAVRRLLRNEPPVLAGGATLGESVEELQAATLALTGSVLAVQGPPGTGKTYSGARMIVAALAAGRKVGVSAQSHAAIRNLLRAVEEHAAQVGVSFTGAYKSKTDEAPGDEYVSSTGAITIADNKAIETDDTLDLIAGTSWLFARPLLRERLDLLFIDEAGQFSLASAVAVGLATDSIVLLGDPQQLPQVTQITHPEGAGASVLEHVLAGEAVMPDGHGVLLTQSWRMHPEICEFVSEHSYEGKLHAHPGCALRRVDLVGRGGEADRNGGGLAGADPGVPAGRIAGAGLRVIEVDSEDRNQSNPDEAEAIAAACRELLKGATVTDSDGTTRPLVPDDILVVAPYNLAVQCIADRVPAGVRVGTVDKFQGQEAPVVFYALTCSTGEDVPRGLDFLFDPNRFNVAVSRAQCLAVLVHSPRLLDADCRTLDAMALVDGAASCAELCTPTTVLGDKADEEPPVSVSTTVRRR